MRKAITAWRRMRRVSAPRTAKIPPPNEGARSPPWPPASALDGATTGARSEEKRREQHSVYSPIWRRSQASRTAPRWPAASPCPGRLTALSRYGRCHPANHGDGAGIDSAARRARPWGEIGPPPRRARQAPSLRSLPESTSSWVASVEVFFVALPQHRPNRARQAQVPLTALRENRQVSLAAFFSTTPTRGGARASSSSVSARCASPRRRLLPRPAVRHRRDGTMNDASSRGRTRRLRRRGGKDNGIRTPEPAGRCARPLKLAGRRWPRSASRGGRARSSAA